MATLSCARLVKALQKGHWSLSAAESCTGGWFAKCLVDTPGASTVFAGGVVSYTNAIKANVLGVEPWLLDTYTAVSAPVAEAMAAGVARIMGTDIGISVTGLAGPGGGDAEIPVGRVYIGLYVRGQTKVFTQTFPGTRTAVRRAAVCHMIHILENCLEQDLEQDKEGKT